MMHKCYNKITADIQDKMYLIIACVLLDVGVMLLRSRDLN